MQQRRPRLGDILDDYCPRERRITNHAVVAMIDDDVRQTRCTTCDAEHEYKQAKVPASRRKKAGETTGDLLPPVLSSPAVEESIDASDEAPVEEPASLLAASQDDAVPGLKPRPTSMEKPRPTSMEKPRPASMEKPRPTSMETGPTSMEKPRSTSVELPRPASVALPEMDDEAQPEETLDDEGPVHRPLIRATLPRPEGQTPERKAPDFTMRQPTGRFDQNRNGQRNRGRQQTRNAGQSFGPPSRGGGPRQGAGRPGGDPQRQQDGNRSGNPAGQRGGRPFGTDRGPRSGGGGQGRKRGR